MVRGMIQGKYMICWYWIVEASSVGVVQSMQENRKERDYRYDVKSKQLRNLVGYEKTAYLLY